MAQLKTRPTDQSVEDFLNAIPDPRRRQDCWTVLEMMKKATGAEPRMWGGSIVGFGSHRYQYASGRGADWFLMGFSPRKQNLTLYIVPGFDRFTDLLKKFGKFKTGKCCLYVNKLADVDLETLQEMIRKSLELLSRLRRSKT